MFSASRISVERDARLTRKKMMIRFSSIDSAAINIVMLYLLCCLFILALRKDIATYLFIFVVNRFATDKATGYRFSRQSQTNTL